MKRAKRYAGRGCDTRPLHQIPSLLRGGNRIDWYLIGKWRTGAEATYETDGRSHPQERNKLVTANDNFADEGYALAA